MSYLYRIALLVSLLLPGFMQAQSAFVPSNADYYHLIDRLEIRRGHWSEGFHSTVKPYNRQGVVQLPDSLTLDSVYIRSLSGTDYLNVVHLLEDSWEQLNPVTASLRATPFCR